MTFMLVLAQRIANEQNTDVFFEGKNTLAESCPDTADGSPPTESTECRSGIRLKKEEFVEALRKQAADSGKISWCLDEPLVSDRINSEKVKRTTHLYQQSKCETSVTSSCIHPHLHPLPN